MSKVLAAAIYARISRDVTGEGLGVERQLAECRKLAARRGWVVAEEYVDNDISAYSGKARPQYERMLEDVAEGRRDAVIAFHTDRLTRRPVELEHFMQVCDTAGLKHFATVTADIDLGNDDGLFMARVLGAVAAKESARKSARLRSKARQNAEQGRVSGGGIRPFAYADDRVTVVESEAAIFRDLATRYLAGESLMSLTNWMQEQGILSVAGKPWHTSVLRTTLTNPLYAGLRAHHGEVVAEAVWPAIITVEQHRQLVAAFARKKTTGRRTPRRYLLSGLLRCGKCGNKLFSSVRKDRKIETRRYVCQSGPDHGGCGKLTVVAAPLEEWIAEAVLIRLDSPAMADALAGRAAADERHAATLAELEADKAQMEELAAMWSAKEISTVEWKTAREPIERRIQTAERQLSQLIGTTTLDEWIGNSAGLRDAWEGLNLTRQAAIIGAVLDYATILPGTPGARGLDPHRVVPSWAL